MASNIIFKKIKFVNFIDKEFNQFVVKKGLFTFPAGPALANIEKSKEYYNSLKNADFVFFDSGFFVLLLKILKNINVYKFSGFKFLGLFFRYLKKNNEKKIFCIDPNLDFSKSNKKLIKRLGVKKSFNYIAPIYRTNNLVDKKLLKLINKFKPDYILINLGGGTQEVLGLYLRKRLKFKVTIFCTGAAISFYTKDQAPITDFIDKYYLGWFMRLLFNPLIFLKKYIAGFKLIPMVIFNKIKVIN